MAQKKRKKNSKKRKKISIWKLLNFKNLQMEIHGYGYEYSFETYASHLFLYLFATFCFGKLYQLQTKYLLILCLLFFLLLPYVFLAEFKRLYEQKRFDDVVKYMRHMMNCYDREPHKILTSLKETLRIFHDEETMYGCIKQSIKIIESNVTDPQLYKNALREIEKEYRCDPLLRMHAYLIRVEEEGGDFHRLLNILMDDTIRWQQRVYLYQKDRKWNQTLAVIMDFICVGFGFFMSIMFLQLKSEINIFTKLSYQVSQTIFLGIYIIIYTRVQKATDYSWLSVSMRGNVKKIDADWETVKHMDKKLERKKALNKSLVLGIPTIIIGLLLKNPYIVLVGVGLGYFLLISPERKQNRAKKRLRKQVELKFPEWLMNVILSLQESNLFLSIQASLKKCPYVLKKEVEHLISEMELHPQSSLPFDHFVKEVTTPEIQTAMGSLYGLGENGGSDVQLATLVENNNLLVDQAEKLKNENKVALFGANMYLPTFVTVLQVGTIMIIVGLGFITKLLTEI